MKNPLETVATKEWPLEKMELVRQTVAQNATDAELALFMYQAQKLGLDPLSKELVFTKYQNKNGDWQVRTITTRDALLKVAMKDPNYMGIQSFPVKEGDLFEIDPQKGTVHHAFGQQRGKILGAWAIAYHKTHVPVLFWAEFSEYFPPNAGNRTWQQYPSAMIQKVAEVGALRRQFNIAGVLAEEEGVTEGVAAESSLPLPATPSPMPDLTATEIPKETPKEEVPKKEAPKETPKEKEAAKNPEPVKDPKQEPSVYTVQGARLVTSKSGTQVWQIALKTGDGNTIQAYAPEGEIFDLIGTLSLPQGAVVQADLKKVGKILEIKSISLVQEEEAEAGSKN